MDRQYLSALAVIVYGAVLLALYVSQIAGADSLTVLRLGPFVLIAATIAYVGVWLVRNPDYRTHSLHVIAWTVGGGATFMALAELVVLNHWVDVAATTPAFRTILDTVTGGSLAGSVAGLYAAQSRHRLDQLQAERDTVERFAHKAESLNRYAKALYESTDLHELSALSVEVVQLLIGSRDAAFVVVDGDDVRVVDATVADPSVLEAIAMEVATDEPMEMVRCPQDTDCRPPSDSAIESIVAVPVPAGSAGIGVLLAIPETDGAYADEDVELLELLSAHLATALVDIEPIRTAPSD